MPEHAYRYEFDAAIEPLEIEATLVLAILAAEAIHGETATRLGLAHCFDAEKRVCVIDATEPVGRDFNSIFVGFARREFGPTAFRARRIRATDAAAVAA